MFYILATYSNRANIKITLLSIVSVECRPREAETLGYIRSRWVQQWRLRRRSSHSARYWWRHCYSCSSTRGVLFTGKSRPPFTTSTSTSRPFTEEFLKLCKKRKDQWVGTMMSRIQGEGRAEDPLECQDFFSDRFCVLDSVSSFHTCPRITVDRVDVDQVE